MKNNFFRALSVMIGYIIGVGMFGLPHITAKSGILVFLLVLLLLTLVQYMLHLIYANVVIETPGKHRMAGYAEIYLGKWGKFFAFLAKLVGNVGGLLAYIIITGIFAYQLFGDLFGGTPHLYSIIFFIIEAFIMLFGIAVICEFELVLTGFLIITIIFISIKGLSFIEPANYPVASWPNILLLYGAMLFALDGIGSIPIAANLVKDNRSDVKRLVKAGTFFSAFLIMLFTLVVTGVTGQMTTPDALTGLKQVMGDGVVVASLILGLLTIITSFVGVGEAVKETLMFDYKLNKLLAWAIAMLLPFSLFLLGFNDLIKVISFAGAVAGGTGSIILILIFRKMEKLNKDISLFKYKPGIILLSILGLMFILGIIYQVWSFIFA